MIRQAASLADILENLERIESYVTGLHKFAEECGSLTSENP